VDAKTCLAVTLTESKHLNQLNITGLFLGLVTKKTVKSTSKVFLGIVRSST
jgi:hypothetical protein